MALSLITETVMDVRTLIEEGVATDGAKSRPAYFIEGIFMQGNVKNQNGRVYPTETLAREAARYQREYIDRKRSFGELGHPENPTVNPDRISHLITELGQDGDNFVGKAKVMVNTPMGNIVKSLLDEGGQLGVSTRGLGSLTETDRGMEVQDDFYLATVDIVMDPSGPACFVRGIRENKAWVWESGILKECVLEKLAQKIDKAHAPTVTTEARKVVFTEAYHQFLTALRRGVKSNIR